MMEESSDFPLPLPQKEFRICLVGDVADDVEVIEAAQSMATSLKAEVVEVENSLQAIETTMIDKWLTLNCFTFFVLKDFAGPIFKRIQEFELKRDCDGPVVNNRRNKDDDVKWILGPPAFKEIAKTPHDLSLKKHALYNYSMAGVVTCFTGIREKTELTELVNRIHFMGGCIRRNMDSKSTHLITRYSSGKKYMYAKTFRLTVVRPEWVDAAWNQRDNAILATNENFSQEYKLTLFEGLKICFFGFPEEEQQHMVDVLKTHGGIATELDDPQCSHVVMPNSVGFMSNTERYTLTQKPNVVSNDIETDNNPTEMMVFDVNAATASAASNAVEDAEEQPINMDVDMEMTENLDTGDLKCIEIKSKESRDETTKENETKSMEIEKFEVIDEVGAEENLGKFNEKKDPKNIDGIVLENEEDEKDFQLDISYISPILAGNNIENAAMQESPEIADITASESVLEKKSKFLRTGSLARKIRYSMNLVADNTPFVKKKQQQQQRNSVYNDNMSDCDSMLDMSAIIEPIESSSNKPQKIEADTSTPIARMLRPRRFLSRKNSNKATIPSKESNSLWRGECKMPTKSSLFDSTIYTTQSTDNKRKRRPSRESIVEMYEATMMNGAKTAAAAAAAVGEDTPKTRAQRPRRNLTISGLPSSFCKRNFFNDTLDKISRKKRTDHDHDAGKLNDSIRSAQLYRPSTNDEDYDDFEYDDINDTMDSCQLSMLSQSSASIKKHKSFGFNGNIGGGSVKRTIRRSIHYVSEKTPISRILRSRRSSVISIDDGKETTTLDDTCNIIERPNKRARVEESTVGGVPEFKTPKVPVKIQSTHSSTASFKANSSSSAAGAASAVAVASTTSTTLVAHVEQSKKLIVASNSNSNSNACHNANSSSTENMQVTQNLVGNLVSSSETAIKKTGDSETVVDEHSTQAKPNPANIDTQILKSDWFWYTIQNGYADEKLYRFADYLDSIANTPVTDRRESLPISLNKRKRKRFSQRLQFEGSPLGLGKRRSSISDAVYSSFSDSFLDCTTSPDTSKIYVAEQESSVLESQTPAKKSLRFLHFMDFVNTESNYVGILETIMKLFKIPLEELAEQDDALLNNTEINLIFGKFHSIHEVHQRMLEHLRDLQNKWTENCLIGDIILELKDELIRSYPPYINSFETMKDTLSQCDKDNPRFHAFLKINQTKPECGRQSLQDLMIRPVQRLPSISLLLNDILKHTGKTNPDYAKLEEALKTIKEVMTYINEDKRKTESRVAIFDIFNDIEGCPAHLVSSNRDFISKCEVIELSEELSRRGDALTFYLFSDTIEVCKKRSRGFNSAKSPGTTKTFKHVKLLPLNAIRFVIDITDSPRAFALLCGQEKDKFYSFSIEDEVDKIVYLKTLCKQMAEHACRANAEKSLISRTSQELNVDISNVNLSTLHKAFKLAARTRIKVGRAFSFNKTPSKLKRAVSTMMTSPFGSTNALTPASQLAQMRLASCTNIHEATDEDGSSRSSSPPIMLEPPLSVQPERKHKTSTLNSLGRL